MKIIETPLPGVLVIEPNIFRDNRGFFLESYREDILLEAGIKEQFVQDNLSRSRHGTLRGLHYQLVKPQGKLVRVTRGTVFDVIVDIRIGSPTFGNWYGVTLDDQNMRMLYVPPDFAHGFLVLSEIADFFYKCTNYYQPQFEHGILWNDPEIDIKWPSTQVKLSDKDKKYPLLFSQAKERLPVYSSDTV